jgi:uncharacterized protein (DUF302 family)
MPNQIHSDGMMTFLFGGTMYEFNTEIDLPFDQAVSRVRDVLMSEHLGVVSDVDVQAIFKNKIDKAIPAYHIYGACNPSMADRVLKDEPNAGTLLPCNFIMREQENGKVVVSFMDPVTVLGLCATEEPKKVAAEAKEKLLRVIDKLNAE